LQEKSLVIEWIKILQKLMLLSDLREDKHYLMDHPGLVPVTIAQGEELRRQIGAMYYIECSSKTQQVKA